MTVGLNMCVNGCLSIQYATSVIELCRRLATCPGFSLPSARARLDSSPSCPCTGLIMEPQIENFVSI